MASLRVLFGVGICNQSGLPYFKNYFIIFLLLFGYDCKLKPYLEEKKMSQRTTGTTARVHTHTHIYIYIYIHTLICICVCECVILLYVPRA